MMFAPLEGVRVLDVTTSIAGPYCTLVLAAFGADVIKIERPGTGDDARLWGPPFWNGESAAFLAMNAGKRSLGVDFKVEEGVEIVLRLAESADVFVQNFRPGLVDRLGLGFDKMRTRQPRIVYCSIGAFGSKGPRAQEPGYDPLMQAAAGIMSITGSEGGRPVRAGVSVVDQGTGLWSALAVLGGLRERDRSGMAQYVETSLYEVALNWVSYQLLGYLATGTVPRRYGSGIGIIAPYEAFETSDGEMMVAAGNDRHFRALCQVVGREELASDPRFESNALRVAHREELAHELRARFAQHDLAYWSRVLTEAGVPAAPVHDLAAVAADEQTQALGILQPLAHDAIPDLQVVGPPLSVFGDRLCYELPPPQLGEHTREILEDAGWASADIDRLVRHGVVEALR